MPQTIVRVFRQQNGEVPSVNYRILYFFHGKNIAVVSHGLTKEDVVPPGDIDEAVDRKRLVISDPKTYTKDFEL